MPVSGLDATYYSTKDMNVARPFYEELIGFAPTLEIPGIATEWTFPGGETFGLYQGDAATFVPVGGVMFCVPDVAAERAKMEARGVRFHGPVEDAQGCHMAFGVDPEGNGFILHKRKAGR